MGRGELAKLLLAIGAYASDLEQEEQGLIIMLFNNQWSKIKLLYDVGFGPLHAFFIGETPLSFLFIKDPKKKEDSFCALRIFNGVIRGFICMHMSILFIFFLVLILEISFFVLLWDILVIMLMFHLWLVWVSFGG